MTVAQKEVVNRTNVGEKDVDRDEVIRVWLTHVKRFISRFLLAGIIPVFCFDGKPPVEKEEMTQVKRKEGKEKNRDRVAQLQEVIRQDPTARTTSMIEQLKKCLRLAYYLGPADYETLRCILDGLGLPYLQATGEAEELCSLLCREGQVGAVYSVDRDNLVHGCPYLITDLAGSRPNPSTGQTEEYVNLISLAEILAGLRMNHSQFIDLCIMCGCDYNTNIPGVGPKTAYKLMTQYGSIDALPSPHKDKIKCLRHVRCREIFSHRHYDQACEDLGHNLQIDRSALVTRARDLLQPYRLDSWIKDFTVMYEGLHTPSGNQLVELGSTVIIPSNSNDGFGPIRLVIKPSSAAPIPSPQIVPAKLARAQLSLLTANSSASSPISVPPIPTSTTIKLQISSENPLEVQPEPQLSDWAMKSRVRLILLEPQ